MNAKTYWNWRYSRGYSSGDGSYGKQLQKKLQWLSGLNINSISEIGCGDFNFGESLMKMYPGIQYFGQDISNVIIEKNKEKYPNVKFSSLMEDVPPADMVMCVDVLFHILDIEDYEAVLNKLESIWTNYLVITAYEKDLDLKNHINERKFDYKRFGEPIIREVVEEDGTLYFYLFKKESQGVDLKNVTCCLNTKEDKYPKEIIDSVCQFPFGEILILTHSDTPYRKHELFRKAKYDMIYYQDDDAICPIEELARLSKTNMINVAMKPGHIDNYKDRRMTMGLGWGSIFPKKVLTVLDRYTNKYGVDTLFMRETEKILTHLYFPQNRLNLPISDLPSANASDRLYRDPQHYGNMAIIEEKCKDLI